MTYYIPAWEKTFENAQSRRVTGPLKWVAMPTDQQSREYKRILRSEHGPSVFGAWCAIVELGARMRTRGVFEDDEGPLDIEDIADETGFPVEIITHAVSVLSSPKINWLRQKKTDKVGERSEHGRSIVDKSMPTLHNITEHNNTPLPPKGDDTPTAKRRASWTKKQLEAEAYEAYPNFQKWWSEYPNGKSKRKTFEAWVKAGLEFEDLHELLSTLHAQRKDPEWIKDDGAYIPHGSTYINAKRYEDDVRAYQAHRPKGLMPKLPPEELR